jgi:AraC-like DNA-binding protein
MRILKNARHAGFKRHSQHLWILDLNPENEIDSLLYSIQPNLSPETKFHACLPSPGLRNIVSYYHQVHKSENAGDECIYPSGNIALVFRCDVLNPKVYLVGTPTVPREPEYIEEGFDYFIVFFRIGEGSGLVSVPASELVDTHVPMDMLCLDKAEKIAVDIAGSRTFMERVRCFERFMGHQKNIVNKTRCRLKSVIDTICSGTHMGRRQRPAHMSERHIRRLFNRYVGVSPIYFKRMVRHQKAIRALNFNPCQDLAGLSAKLGYCDQSHFIHEFKRFHGMSPGKFLKTYLRTEKWKSPGRRPNR